jgi:hypothetical protein
MEIRNSYGECTDSEIWNGRRLEVDRLMFFGISMLGKGKGKESEEQNELGLSHVGIATCYETSKNAEFW